MQMTPPQFVIIPYQLIQDEKIQSLDERVYGVIYWLTQLKGERCTASNTTLAGLCNTNSGSLRNSLTRLERREYILRTYKDEERKKRDEIKPLIIFAKVSSGDARVSSTDDRVSSGNDTGVSSTDAQNKSSTIKKSTKEYTPSKDGEESYPADFIAFWKEYPRKVGKPKAYKAWKKLQPSQELQNKIISAVKAHRESGQWKRDNGRYIPHPTSWLNREGWNDEVDSSPSYEKADKVIRALWGEEYVERWRKDDRQLYAADYLGQKKTIEELQSAMNFYRNHKGEKGCPAIHSPNQLLDKWDMLLAHKERV